MKVKVKNEKNVTCAIRLEIFEYIYVIFFQNFNYLATYVYAKRTHTHTHTHSLARVRGDDYRTNLQSRFS